MSCYLEILIILAMLCNGLGRIISRKENFMNRIEFDGTFNDETRREFKKRRVEHRLSYMTLGKILRVSWVTVRNWETGISRSCQSAFIDRIAKYLNGELDKELSLASQWKRKSYNEMNMMEIGLAFQRNAKVLPILLKIRDTYNACSGKTELREMMLSRIRELSRETLRRYISIKNSRV